MTNQTECIACLCAGDDRMWCDYGCPDHTCHIIDDIAESDAQALRFITTGCAATQMPDEVFISCEDMEKFRKLKEEINSKTPEQLHREAQERWDNKG